MFLSLSSLSLSLLLFAIKQLLLLTRVQDSFFPFPFFFFCIDLVVTETDAAALAAFAAAFAADLVGVLFLQTLRIPRLRERSQRSCELRAALVNIAPIKATSNGRRGRMLKMKLKDIYSTVSTKTKAKSKNKKENSF